MNIVFSYDCEGNWGFVDWESPPLGQQQEAALSSVYAKLIELHHQYQIPATFAFVGLYGLPSNERREYISNNLPGLLELHSNFGQSGSCWEGAGNLAAVANAVQQQQLCEIGSHSLTHLPLNGLTEKECIREFEESANVLSTASSQQIDSFIYPRNLLAFPDRCLQTFRSFRETPAHSKLSRGLELARTASGIELSRKKTTSDFVFAKCGVRKRLSERGWKRCWLNRFKNQTLNSKRTIHVWSHPHDSVSDPEVINRIEWLMKLMVQNRKQMKFSRLSEVTVCTRGTA